MDMMNIVCRSGMHGFLVIGARCLPGNSRSVIVLIDARMTSARVYSHRQDLIYYISVFRSVILKGKLEKKGSRLNL